MPRIWKPSVTVAAIVEKDGKFLLIEEETSDGIRLNQPAGHLDPLESLEQAVVREVLEETAFDFTPESLVGVYLSRYRGHDPRHQPEPDDHAGRHVRGAERGGGRGIQLPAGADYPGRGHRP